jgi:hypothetical protein
MPINAKPTPGSTLLNPTNHALILVDFQSQMAFATKSIDAVNLTVKRSTDLAGSCRIQGADDSHHRRREELFRPDVQ